MMHRSKKLLGSGEQEYFNEKRPVNVRVDRPVHLVELFGCPRAADEYQPSPWFCPSGRQTGSNGAIRSPGIPSGSPVIQHKTQSRETPQVAASLSGPRLAACEVGVTAETTLLLSLARESRRASRSESNHLVGLDHVGAHTLRESRIKLGGILPD